MLSDSSATGITYGLAGRPGQPWVQSYTPAGSTSPVYVLHDQQGTPLGYVQAGKSYAWVTDNIGSVFLVIGTAGTSGTNGSVAGFNYDPYGHITGTLLGSVPENLIRYAGGLADPTTGYTHLGQRWYSPTTGAFTTQDSNSYLGNPANGNRYAYAASNPVNYIDPTGNDIWSCAGTGSVIGTVIGGIGGALVGGLVSGGIGAVPGFFLGAGEGATLGTIIGGVACGIAELF